MDDSIEDIDKKEDGTNEEQNTDIDFVYSDADEYSVEIAELYSYSEEAEFEVNRRCFEEDFSKFVSVKWFETTNAERHAHIQRLLDRLESSNQMIRHRSARSLLYLLQGNFGDCELEEDQITRARHNVYLCIEAGLLQSVLELLLYIVEYDSWTANPNIDPNVGGDCGISSKPQCEFNPNSSKISRSAVNLTDSTDLRVVLSILYIMVETVRDGMLTDQNQQCEQNPEQNTSTDSLTKLREQFVEDLASPIGKDAETTLTLVLLGMVGRFCNGLAPHFPMKKVLLLLWKVLLITLGPLSGLFSRKNQARARYNLPPLFEDSTDVIRRVRANSPPGTSADQLLSRIPRNNNKHSISGQSNQAPRQGSLAGGRLAFQQQSQQQQQQQQDQCQPTALTTVHFPFSGNTGRSDLSLVSLSDPMGAGRTGLDTPRPSSPVSGSSTNPDDIGQLKVNSTDKTNQGNEFGVANSCIQAQQSSQTVLPNLSNLAMDWKTLPWKPKVKKKDLETFLSNVRLKFIGFHVPNDTVSLAGLPEPIHEAVRVMREHLYISLGEMQIERENEIARNPVSMGRGEIPDTPAERLYRAMYPLISHYMIALLKVLLAAGPTSRTKTESINILAEVTPEEMPTSVLQTTILNIDMNRHKEIIVKAISALLLLLLKQFKLNHIYQFEYVSQYLVFANCIPLILKFFNQNTCLYVQAKNTISCLEFPAHLIGKPPELTPDILMGDWSSYCWRNLFACINLLRILNMLTKGKLSRTMLLIILKSAPILKRALRVRHAMLQLYLLKLLKLQSRYFGRQWRKSNMSIMSAIYQKVRHRLTDDWAYGNDVDTIPWQFQFEERSLRNNMDQFNQRRYCEVWLNPEFVPVDNCLMSVLSEPVQLSEEFKQNYEKWLEEEVFSVPINWSQVLAR